MRSRIVSLMVTVSLSFIHVNKYNRRWNAIKWRALCLSVAISHGTRIGLCRFVATKKNEKCQVACWTAYYTQTQPIPMPNVEWIYRIVLVKCAAIFPTLNGAVSTDWAQQQISLIILCHLFFFQTWMPSAVYLVHFKCDIKHMFRSSSVLMISKSSSKSHTHTHTQTRRQAQYNDASNRVRACVLIVTKIFFQLYSFTRMFGVQQPIQHHLLSTLSYGESIVLNSVEIDI